MMKIRYLLIPVCAVPALYFWIRSSQDSRLEPQSKTAVLTGNPHSPAKSEDMAPPSAALPPESVSASPVKVAELPRTTAELNAFADGPLPLGEKMDVLTRLMKQGTADEAKAAAIRAVHLVQNAEFAARLQPLIVEAAVKPEALEVFALNLYDRPLDVLLPAWALIRETPGHPLQAVAADGLEFHLKEKAGAGGDALTQVIRDHLFPPQR